MVDCTEPSSATPALETYESLTSFIDTITNELIEYTVFPSREHKHMPWLQVRKYLRDTARSLRRPDIFYETCWYSQVTGRGRTVLDLPKRKYLEPVIAPLLLLRNSPVVEVEPSETRTILAIKDAHHIFHGWLERTRTDPEWRKILGLPTE